MSRIHYDGSITLYLSPRPNQVPALAYRQGRMHFSDFTIRAFKGRAILTLSDLPHPPLLVSIPHGIPLNSLRHRICELRKGTKYWSLYFKAAAQLPQPNPDTLQPDTQPPGPPQRRRAPMPSLARHVATQPPPWPTTLSIKP